MIKKIVQVADVHIPNYQRMEEYEQSLSKFVSCCKEELGDLDPTEMRIIICGDLVHQKNTISNELNVTTANFIRSLSEICKVIVISGNHDMVVNNTSRIDTISAIFETAQFSNAIFLDYACGYESSFMQDDNCVYALYSIWDKYMSPFDKNPLYQKRPEQTLIGLYHGVVVGARNFNGTTYEEGQNPSAFSKCDFVLAGDIHKRQVIDCDGTKFVYSGSLLQRDFGESIQNHGYAVWTYDDTSKSYLFEYRDMTSDYGFYKFSVETVEDLDNDLESLDNLL